MIRLVATSVVAVLAMAGCGKKDEGSSPGPGGAAPGGGKTAEQATPVWKDLAPLGLQIEVPSSATLDDSSSDAPAVTVSAEGCTVNVSTVTAAYASDYVAAVKEIEKEPNPFQKFTRQAEREGGWHLEYELKSMMDGSPLYGVQVRSSFDDQQYECGRNGRTEAERDCVARACLTLRKP